MFKGNLVILKIIWNAVENIELLLIKKAHFRMHRFWDTLYIIPFPLNFFTNCTIYMIVIQTKQYTLFMTYINVVYLLDIL